MRPGGSAQAHQVANSHGRPVCSLSACGERVGVRGPVQKGGLVEGKGAFPRSSDSWRGPLTRNLREERANSDLSIARPTGPAFGRPDDRLRRAYTPLWQAGRGNVARLSLNLTPM